MLIYKKLLFNSKKLVLILAISMLIIVSDEKIEFKKVFYIKYLV